MVNKKNLIEKLFWSFAPLAWGAFVWFVGWGYGSQLISYGGPNLLLRTLIVVCPVIVCFANSYNKAQQNYHVTFFNYLIPLPSWKLFIIAPILASCLAFFLTPLWEYKILHSLILTVIISSCLEELITHSIFIKYPMRLWEFLFFNTLTATTFTLMHAGYTYELPSLTQLFTTGYFPFGFAMGILAYRTRRIEIPIIYHLTSNFLNQTLPHVILLKPLPLVASIALSLLLPICLLGLSYRSTNIIKNP